MKVTTIEGQRYSCIGCGKCCQNWNVPVTPEEQKNLESVDWSRFTDRVKAGESLFENGVLRHLGTRCVFLEPDLKCLIHAKVSYDAKPLVCKQFPLLAVDTPDGRLISASFCCPTVARNLGPLLGDPPENKDLFTKAITAYEEKDEVLLLGQTKVPWTEFAKTQQEFLGLAKNAELTFPQKLVAIYHRGYEAGKAKVNNRDQKPLEESIAFAKNQNEASEGLKARLIRGLFLAFIGEAFIKGNDQTKTSFVSGFLGQTISLAFGWGSFQVKAWGEAVPIKEVNSVPFNIADQANLEILERYLRALITRGQILTQKGLFRGVCTLLVVFCLINWFSRLASRVGKKTSVDCRDIESGIDLMENIFVQHGKGLREFTSTGLFALMFETLMVNSGVASSLVFI